MIGQTISHYKILDKLGEGGMGVVYKAEDTNLKREVAIKFLPRQIAANEEEGKRFKIEAQAAAALNHANIATIYNIEEVDDEMFIVMEYIKGQELKDKIEAGPIPIYDTLNLAIQIAQGLQAAHEEGVVHRDIKSANIMLTLKGSVKIMDFGLAKISGKTKLTKEGTTLGTVAYMSPEQARGDEVDHRSDIFSLGVLLYEMLTGQLPFKGDYDPAITYSVMNEDPEPVTALRTGIPMELERIVSKCLEKDASGRYQNMVDLIVDLKKINEEYATAKVAPKSVRVSSRTKKMTRISIGVAAVGLLTIILFSIFRHKSAEPIDSIAVLPLENLSMDSEQEYFVDGMTDAIITELSKISALRVISRRSVMQYKDVRKPLSTIAKELNVKSILEGSVIQFDDQVRISVQLIGLSPERHLWANNFDRQLTNFLILSSEVASEIAREIKITVTPEEQKRLKQVRLVNPEANQLYLRAQYQMEKSTTRETTEKGFEHLQKAIEIDPDFALAYVGLSNAYLRYANTGYASRESVLPKAKSFLQKALEIDSTLGDAYATLSDIRFQESFDWLEREEYLRKAIRLNSSSAGYHASYSDLLSNLGRHEEAIREMVIAQRLDPLSLSINTNLGNVFFYAGRYDEAIDAYRNVLELEPEAINPKWWLARAYEQKGMYQEAIAEFLSRKVKSPGTNWALAYTYAVAGYPDRAKQILDYLLEKEKKTYIPPKYIAQIYIGLGDKDMAFEWLEKNKRISNIKTNPWYDSIRDDPRFEALVSHMNFPDD